MKVVFLEEVEGTARTGEVKNVADGFARNYLLPRRLAAPATEHYIAIAQAKATKEARRQERLDEEARRHVLPKVDGKSVRIEVRVGEQGKLFGSVTARDIAEALQEATHVELEHRQVDLREPIRQLGSYQVPVKLTRNVVATVTVEVAQLGAEEAAGPEGVAEVEAEEPAVADAQVEAVAEVEETDQSQAGEETGAGDDERAKD
jgi:large subunit ribosomal protein L9